MLDGEHTANLDQLLMMFQQEWTKYRQQMDEYEQVRDGNKGEQERHHAVSD